MKRVLLALLGATVLIISVGVIWIAITLRDLPDVSVLKNYRPPAAAEVLDRDGNILTHYYDDKFRIWVPIAVLPDTLIKAVTTAEDDEFFEHQGVNYRKTWEALQHDVQKRRFARGGSTITQQMIKNVLLSKEKTLKRKIREYVLAQRAEELLTKRRILEIYLNEVEWGENLHGIEAAGRFYFDRHASDLNIPESALLAGMLPNPKYYNPFKRMDKAKQRQEQVLFNMQQAKLITQEEYAAALRFPIILRPESGARTDLPPTALKGTRPCYQTALESVLVNAVGEQKLYRSGTTVRTTLDRAMQNDLAGWEQQDQNANSGTLERISVVKDGDQVRALACTTGRAAEILSKFEFLGMNIKGYEVLEIAPDTIRREQIIASTDSPSGGTIK